MESHGEPAAENRGDQNRDKTIKLIKSRLNISYRKQFNTHIIYKKITTTLIKDKTRILKLKSLRQNEYNILDKGTSKY